MFSKNIKFYKGVTFMELLVVIAIMGIMAATGFSMWRSTKGKSYVRDAQREIASSIKTAQSYALQGKVQNGDAPFAYGVRIVSSSAYEIFYYATPTDATNNNGTMIESFSFNKGAYTGISLGSRVYFKVPFGDAIGSPGIPLDIPIMYPGVILSQPITKYVRINSNGSITEDK